jgi:hypothetical protein
MSYTPTAGALDGRLCLHLARVPDDELSPADIARKFDTPVTLVEVSLASAITARVLERKRGGTGGRTWMYCRGPRFEAAMAAAAAEPAPSPKPPFPGMPPPSRTKRAPLPVFDAAALAVEADVAMPASKRGAQTDWPVLFERLTAVGMCSCPLPKLVKGSLAGAANAWFKPRGLAFAIRAISETHLRIWRVDPTTKEAK